MINSTQVSYFILAAYFDTRGFKYLLFLLILSLYVFIICTNLLLIVVICMNRSLHEPMYLFLCSLFVNELYGSTGLFPFLLVQILSDIHTVSASFCFLQIFCLYSYGGVEFWTLAIMSYDRYLAICYPLQYHTRMTSKKIAVLIALTWLYSFLRYVLIVSGLTAPLQLCGNIINKVYCDNYSVVNLACSDTRVNNIFGLVHIFTVIFGLKILILFSYMRILKVCLSGSKQTRQKALSTCTPQLFSLLNFSCGGFFELVQSRFNMNYLPNMLRIFLSLYWLTFQPLINPLLYGLKMSKIRIICRLLLFGGKRAESALFLFNPRFSYWPNPPFQHLGVDFTKKAEKCDTPGFATVEFFDYLSDFHQGNQWQSPIILQLCL
ncbi:olfactory receptor 11A1-like [Perca flavescens]|uniref:olfactory receptor 11A1-like n=1 Tax=Perca flavescens TaxID=8167 RepID=UPI00106EFAE0|nr:olfactory receptor 11A1-like [Perca flavescens]